MAAYREERDSSEASQNSAYCYNYISFCLSGDGAAVLLRALQPVENLEIMDKLRTKGKEGNSLLKKEGVGLCNGPSKLCQALGIKKDTVNKVDLCHSNDIWLEKGETIDDSRIVKCKRININYAEEWKDKPLRFYIKGNIFNSVKDKKAESAMSG
ncbi:DNA-3-methyladenine glycosylase-like [Mercenaria mercenaria]|uniref:DNA-3-methyladenine glycosylase-like n=1 Tax=Mercenaria mercenaria TaxID=6596 RepID=UPI00234EB2D1|nr:DNA-3-methyladenine glycosylase-like [Mercenaria mercenaria]